MFGGVRSLDHDSIPGDRLREVLEDELGLEDVQELPIGVVKPVLGFEVWQSLQATDVALLERGGERPMRPHSLSH